jgi:NAD(P)-dependent dehydrogenase (short-subunit alcohol dehydrogenase family)
MENPSRRVWLITGCSTGFGFELCKLVLAQNDLLVATSRNLDPLNDLRPNFDGQLLTLQLDVTDASNVKRVVAAAVQEFGRIDVLVNNAGYGLAGTLEEATDEELREQFETNLFGTLAVTRAVLPAMRQQRSGRILVISSIAGLVSNLGLCLYNGSKYALEGVFEGLAQDVGPLGIKVTIIEPGPFRTKFAGSSLRQTAPMPEYAETAGRIRHYFDKIDGTQEGDPVRAAQIMLDLVKMDQPPLRLLLGKVAISRLREKYNRVLKDAESWQAVTLSADFPEAGPN